MTGGRAMGAPGFGIYVHWPFCQSKCPYCDFNSHVRSEVDTDRWQRALLVELDHFAVETHGRLVTSIFFGGGTPSLMPPPLAGAVIDRIAQRWAMGNDVEITLEANPTSVEAGAFADFRLAGVNRASVGVQAFNDDDLRFLGRQHSAAEARDAIELAARHFQRFSFDLIYARPGQTVATWQQELKDALSLAAGHLSLYQLTIEPGTRFATQCARGDFAVPDEPTAAALFEETQALTQAAGLPAYEISNHARPGEACRHNLTYWRYGDYVGVGPGAHGRLTLKDAKWATRTHRAPEIWLQRVERDGHAEHDRTFVSIRERVEELMMMGLRLTEGIPHDRIEQEIGGPWDRWLDAGRVDALKQAGFLLDDDGHLAATTAGRQRLNAVLEHLLVRPPTPARASDVALSAKAQTHQSSMAPDR
ncbi:MAG: radical SAM family heme chaperone HemW [Pseudomonadota bacterium]